MVVKEGGLLVPKITLAGVTKRFGALEVLPPLDLDLADGEFTVLVGPSGCGKSTTLRMLAGLETISGGEIFFDGRPVGALEPKDRDIAMVFQDYALYPHMNIARNMSFALRLAKTPASEIEKRVKLVADMLNISHLLHRKPSELSGGQRQRVAMGRALVRDASTFLFDEPLSNLDAKLRGKMRTELAEMRGKLHKNMIYVTHDQVEAMTLGDRIVVMSEGRIQQQGSPEELFKKPANMFVAGFIGSPSMNFITAVLEGRGQETFAISPGLCVPVPSSAAEAAGGREIVVGVRPSSIHLEHPRGIPIELRVVVSEYLGAQTVVAARTPDGTEVLVEIASGRRFCAGEAIIMQIVPEDILLFSKESGLRI
ncbi:ABC transporter ATP-binding protein [Rhizobium sp. SL86]|uniref:ABC transporter ATP-binding protein n=1 Tax=Rhizobium sp. SL86 TaxID=2995148 RepID=UPI002274B1B7|nr:ABC transporter ATP-binding protein [Rhizobium sp. SL86]MCY1667720.1 ABC transporter ATP-binding protein [Rhizobium sp. SL86]